MVEVLSEEEIASMRTTFCGIGFTTLADSHESLRAERDNVKTECEARGNILDQVQAATGSTWWHGAIDWANNVLSACLKADSTEDYRSTLKAEHVPAWIWQLAKERDHANRMRQSFADTAYQQIAELNSELTTLRATLATVEAERDGWKSECEMLRQLGQRQREEVENLSGMADAVERLREIGKVIGCDHVDDEDGRRRLVNCVEESFTEYAANNERWKWVEDQMEWNQPTKTWWVFDTSDTAKDFTEFVDQQLQEPTT